jgi:hypothetical protein
MSQLTMASKGEDVMPGSAGAAALIYAAVKAAW